MIDFEERFAGTARPTENAPAVAGFVPFLKHIEAKQVAVPVARLVEQRRA